MTKTAIALTAILVPLVSTTVQANVFEDLQKALDESIFRPLRQALTVNVTAHNATDRPVVVEILGERVTLGPHAKHIFRAVSGDRIIAQYFDPTTGYAIGGEDHGPALGHSSLFWNGKA